MPISNNIISGHTVIVNPDSIADVQTAIGSGSGDMGTLCESPYINKWAKYKPVILINRLNTTNELNGSTGDANRTWKSSATWYKGSNGTCGMQVRIAPEFWNQGTADTSKQESIREAEALSLKEWFESGWQYLFYPRGGMSSPYRILDFHYYDHNAVAFVKSLNEPSNHTYYAGGSSSITWQMVLPTGNEGDLSLSFNDISPLDSSHSLGNYYFGLIFVNVGSNFPVTPNLIYRKYVVVNTVPINNSNGKTITLTSGTTSALIDSGNPRADVVYLVYPIIVTNPIGSAQEPFVIFGTQDCNYGSMIPIPNAEVFSITFEPNPLDGSLEAGYGRDELDPDVYTTDGTNRTYDGSSIFLTNRSGSDITFSRNSISLELEIWRLGQGGSYTKSGTSTSVSFDSDVPSSITIASGASKTLGFSWIVPESNFSEGQTYKLRQTGEISYTAGGDSKTTVLLANPPYDPNSVVEPMNFQSHITIDNIGSSGFNINVWAENISANALDFSWSSVVYDVISYSKTSTGTDYDNPDISLNNAITGTTETGIAAGGTTSVKTLHVDAPNGTGITGYLTSVTVHSNTGSNVGDSSATANYPAT